MFTEENQLRPRELVKTTNQRQMIHFSHHLRLLPFQPCSRMFLFLFRDVTIFWSICADGRVWINDFPKLPKEPKIFHFESDAFRMPCQGISKVQMSFITEIYAISKIVVNKLSVAIWRAINASLSMRYCGATVYPFGTNAFCTLAPATSSTISRTSLIKRVFWMKKASAIASL